MPGTGSVYGAVVIDNGRFFGFHGLLSENHLLVLVSLCDDELPTESS